MLENEPTGGEERGSEPTAAETAAPATPVKRTRARKSTAAAAAESGEESPAPVRRRRKAAKADIDGASGQTPSEGTEDAVPPPVKATRTRRRKAAEPAVTDSTEVGGGEPAGAVEPGATVAGAAEDDAGVVDTQAPGVPGEPVGDEEEELEATTEPLATDAEPVMASPAPLAGSAEPSAGGAVGGDEPAADKPPRRSRRSAADAGSGAEGSSEGEPPARRRRTPAATVLFMAPEPDEEPVPTRRTRRSRSTAAEVPAESTAGEPAGADAVAAAGTGAAAAPAPAPAPASGEEEPVEEGAGRRRRRSRRTAAEEVSAVEAEVADNGDEVEPAAEEADDDESDEAGRRRRRRGRRGRGRGKGPVDEGDEAAEPAAADEAASEDDGDGEGVTRRRRRRRRKGDADTGGDDGVHTVVRIREPRTTSDEVQGVSGSTRLEAKRQRRRDGREQRRTRPPILSESEFLARREAVDRVMVVRQRADRTQIGVLEDGILVEHYVTRASSGTMAGNVYLGKVQNVLPSMEAAFVDIGRGRNAVLYAGEVNWDASGLEGRARSIEQALRSGDSVLVQVTKDPIGHKGARLTSHIALSGRHLVYVPGGNASGISRKLPDTERKRLRDVLKKLVPEGAGVIVRTAAEGASEDELARDVKRLQAQWDDIQAKAAAGGAPVLLYEEPDLLIRVVRDLFNEDFRELVIQGDDAYEMVENYLGHVSPDLVPRLRRHTSSVDVFAEKRIDEQILKGLDRKVFLPSGGHLVIDRTEAMTVVDVNTGKYTGAGGNLEETVTRNNLEAAEEIVRQLRLRDLGGIVVIDFIDMVLESNRELVLRRLTECLGRDRTKHQVTEITSLGLVQMTRKRIGAGLLEAFSETCEACKGRGLIIHTEPVPAKGGGAHSHGPNGNGAEKVKAVASASSSTRRRGSRKSAAAETPAEPAVVDDDDTMGYDLSRYDDVVLDPADEVEAPTDAAAPSNGRLAGVDDPDAAGDDEDLAESGGTRRRGRRGGTRRRTRP